METLFYLLRFKALDRRGLSIHIGLIVFSTLFLLYLINSIAYRLLFDRTLSALEYFEYLGLSLFDPKIKLLWIPEIVLIAILGIISLWLLAVVWPYLYDCICLILTPPSLKLEDLELEDCLNNIDFQGKVEKKDTGFFITSSGSGMLFKHYWKDFKAEFEFKFEGESGGSLKASYERTKLQNEYITVNNYLGFIFRARDFDNYFMLSIGVKTFLYQVKNYSSENLRDKESLLITPHVKVGGAWNVFTENKWPIPESFNVGGENKLIIQVKRSTLKLWIQKNQRKWDSKNLKGNKKNGEPFFIWYLPTHYLVNWGKEKKEDSPGDSSKIPFRNSIGRIGFRAYGDERFLIKNLRIERLV